MEAWRSLPRSGDAARRALPIEDPSIDALPPDVRERVASSWLKRAEAELAAGSVLANITAGLFAEDVPREILWLAARGTTDEIRHAELCLHVANRYANRELPRPASRRADSARAGALVHAIANGAINETIASAFLNASIEVTTAPLAQATLRELLTDEIDHARIGWAVLGDPSPRGAALRGEVERHLRSLVGVVRDAWLAAGGAAPSDLPREHGCLPGPEVVEIVDSALRDLVLPGFAHVGVDPRSAESLLG